MGQLHVLNLKQEAAENSDYEVTVEDIVNYENKYGKIRPGSIVSTDSDLSTYSSFCTMISLFICHLFRIKTKDFHNNPNNEVVPTI